MEIKSQCSHCGQHIAHPVEMKGQMFQCPNCSVVTQLGGGAPVKRRSIFYYVFWGTVSLIATLVILAVALGMFTGAVTGVIQADTKAKRKATQVEMAKEPSPESQYLKPLSTEELELLPAAATRLVKSVDKFEDITWYSIERTKEQQPKYDFFADIYMELHFGTQPGRKPWLRLLLWYYGDKFVLVDEYKFRCDELYFTIPARGHVKRDVGSLGKVWETMDIEALPHLDIITEAIKSKSVIMRMSGEHPRDHKVERWELDNMRDVLLAFRAFYNRQELKPFVSEK